MRVERLPFTLPDFCRTSWVSAAAREYWQPKLKQVREFWNRLETTSVVCGWRPAGLTCIHSNDLSVFRTEAERQGLYVHPLHTVSPRGYASELNSYNGGPNFNACVVARGESVSLVSEAFHANASDELGRLFKYPRCCIDFFTDIWLGEGWIDTTWPMALRTLPAAPAGQQSSLFEAAVRPENNILLRWLGARPVFHLPCSFNCDATHETANCLKQVAQEAGEHESLELLYEVLTWPVQWSALHGIAEIETPVFRISTRTDATAEKCTVRLLGSGFPEVGSTYGTRFPFRERPKKASAGLARREGRSLQVSSRTADPPGASSELLEGSGFHSQHEMDCAFAPLLKLVMVAKPRSVLHLGCKNGALLHAVAAQDRSVKIFGVEQDAAKLRSARTLLGARAGGLFHGNPIDTSSLAHFEHTDLFLVMIGRLLESKMEKAREAIEFMKRQNRTVIVYAFDDWLRRGSLRDMASEVGVGLCEVAEASACACGVLL